MFKSIGDFFARNYEGVIAGIIIFIACELIAWLFKRSKGLFAKFKSKVGKINRHLKGKYSVGEIFELWDLPPEKRTKRQQRALDEANEIMKKTLEKTKEISDQILVESSRLFSR